MQHYMYVRFLQIRSQISATLYNIHLSADYTMFTCVLRDNKRVHDLNLHSSDKTCVQKFETHMHKAKKKGKGNGKVSSCGLVRHCGAWPLIRRFMPVLANPPGRGLLPRRWGCTMPRVMVWAPKVPSGSHPLVDMDSILNTHTYKLGYSPCS